MLQSDLITMVPDSIPSVKEELSMLKTMPIDDLLNKLVGSMVQFTINLAVAILVFYVGKFIIKRIFNFVKSIMLRRQVDASLSTFVLSLIRIVMYFILIVIVIGILGIETSSFIAIFASAGVAVGMALSGTLQNFAGGVLILLIKPYKVGDYIETQGYAGYVREIQIFHTIINTYDNKAIILPNGGLSTGSINNWSREDYRRLDWSVSISYGDNVDDARAKLLEIMLGDSRVVEKYVEDDRERRNAELDATLDDDCGDDPDCIEQKAKKKGWLSRLFANHHRRVKERIESHQAAEAQKIADLLPRVDRSPRVVVDALADSSVVLKARAWTHTDNYWSVLYDINERIYKELPSVGIRFPFPQLDVTLKNSMSSNK